jgi:hypothetical protein
MQGFLCQPQQIQLRFGALGELREQVMLCHYDSASGFSKGIK